MDFTLLILAALGLGLAIPLFMDDDDEDGEDAPQNSEADLNLIEGDDDRNTLTGTPEDDLILGLGERDIINGLSGNDTIRAGEGNDLVDGGEGRDIIRGGDGPDDLFGGIGIFGDKIQGGDGDDRIDGGRGIDDLDGGPGNDTILGGAPALEDPTSNVIPDLDTARGDTIHGDDGNDTLFSWGGQGLTDGGKGADTIVLVTGQGTLSDDGSGTTDNAETEFFVLDNDEDNAGDLNVVTRATITDFDPALDSLVLTVDGDTAGEVTFSTTDTTRMVDGQEVSGVLVRANFADDPGEEGAAAFLVGLSETDIAAADISVVFTNDADYFDPEETLQTVRDTLAAR